MNRQFSDVFKPGTYPQRTYVSRHSKETKYTYEERLKQSLSIEGYLTYIVGPSKIGKTVLCENVIGAENMVSMSGMTFPGAGLLDRNSAESRYFHDGLNQ